jgi:hypothetical protein
MAIFGIHVYPSLQESDDGSGKYDPGKPRRLGRMGKLHPLCFNLVQFSRENRLR